MCVAWRAAAAIVSLATVAAAQGAIDVTGTWTCAIEEYAQGETEAPDLFNVAIYRTGAYALSGRRPDGEVYQGNGTWKFGRNASDGTTVTLTGKTLVEGGVPEPFEIVGDLVSPDEISRITRRYARTRAVECVRQPGGGS